METPPFSELGLPESLLAAIETLGYERPSPIQAMSIPPALAGKDLVGLSATGSGKTAAFALPALAKLDIETSLPAGADPVPDPRTRGAGLRGGPPPRREDARPARHARLWWRADGPPAPRPARWRAIGRRHARPPARSPAARQFRSVAHQDGDPRRGRPHARHGLQGRNGRTARPRCRRNARPCFSPPP